MSQLKADSSKDWNFAPGSSPGRFYLLTGDQKEGDSYGEEERLL